MAEINFLSQQQKIVESRVKNDKTSFIFIIIIAVLAAGVYGVVWLISDHYKQEADAVAQQITDVKAEINRNLAKQEGYLVFVDKLNKMTTLLNKREGGTEAMDDLYHYFLTDSTAIVTSTYDYYTRIFELDLAANDIFSLAKLINLIQDESFTSKYKNIYLASLSRDARGTYRLKAEVGI